VFIFIETTFILNTEEPIKKVVVFQRTKIAGLYAIPHKQKTPFTDNTSLLQVRANHLWCNVSYFEIN